jgi:hypothetical protein
MALCCSTPTGADVTVKAWTPESAMLSKLDDPQPIGRYLLRPPKGYSPQTTPSPGGSTGYAWVTKPRHDGTRDYILVAVGTDSATRSLDDLLDAFMAGIREHHNDVKESPVETGTINSLAFERAYWVGIVPELGVNMHGFVYVANDGGAVIEMSSQDVEPYSKKTLRLTEASALTLQRQKML